MESEFHANSSIYRHSLYGVPERCPSPISGSSSRVAVWCKSKRMPLPLFCILSRVLMGTGTATTRRHVRQRRCRKRKDANSGAQCETKWRDKIRVCAGHGGREQRALFNFQRYEICIFIRYRFLWNAEQTNKELVHAAPHISTHRSDTVLMFMRPSQFRSCCAADSRGRAVSSGILTPFTRLP